MKLIDSYLSFSNFKDKCIHLGITGSIAAYKSLDLLRAWQNIGIKVSATLTEAAIEFVRPLSFEALGAKPVYNSMFATGENPLSHLQPGQEADVLAVVPCSATTISRMVTGLASDMLSAQVLAFSKGSVVFAPAMNPKMWANKATQENVQKLISRGFVCVSPGLGKCACLEEGEGRLADLRDIYLAVLKELSPQDLAGKEVLVTIGPTYEHFDPVRFLGNPSSGLMGASLAVAAYLRGANVFAVCGPNVPWLPRCVSRVNVTSAREMFDACANIWNNMDIGCFTAAVSDFRPLSCLDSKIKKENLTETLQVSLTQNPDILATFAKTKTDQQKVIGFAAECADLENYASKKIVSKNADMIVANLINQEGSGFVSETNAAYILDIKCRSEFIPTLPKADLAWRVWDWLLTL